MTNTRKGPRRKLRHLVRDWDKGRNTGRITDIWPQVGEGLRKSGTRTLRQNGGEKGYSMAATL